LLAGLTGNAKVQSEGAGQAPGNTKVQSENAGQAPPHERDRERALRARAGIDALQISVGERWRRYVRSTAVWVSGVVAILLIRYGDFAQASRPTFILTALLLGGVVAWFARDVSAGVERWRR
jgi:hypothetical protein